MSELMNNVDYIFDNREEFRAKYADVIAKFEAMGIESKMAEAMTITIAAKAKTISDMMA
jgi:hypothetical protein